MFKRQDDDGGRSLSNMRKVLNLVLISASNLFGGVSLSLLSPFYSAEALLKGVTFGEVQERRGGPRRQVSFILPQCRPGEPS